MLKRASILSLALLLGACFIWSGQEGVSQEQAELGVKPVSTLQAEYESQKAWGDVRRRVDGLTNSLQRDLGGIFVTIDRHFFNYSPNDPYVNHPTNENYLSVTLFELGTGVGGWVLPWIPTN